MDYSNIDVSRMLANDDFIIESWCCAEAKENLQNIKQDVITKSSATPEFI